MNVFLELHNSALYIYITFTSIIINIIEICKSCITTTQLFSYYMKSAYFRKKKCFAASAQNLIIRQENVIMPLSTAYHS